MSHEKQDGVWKDANSPAGHAFYAPVPEVVLDCPNCRYGTPRMGEEPNNGWKCDECKAEFTLDELKAYNRLRR